MFSPLTHQLSKSGLYNVLLSTGEYYISYTTVIVMYLPEVNTLYVVSDNTDKKHVAHIDLVLSLFTDVKVVPIRHVLLLQLVDQVHTEAINKYLQAIES